MENWLTPEEVRVLGSLIEKELSTPEYYPLTLNALVAACNQKNNRDPVVQYEEAFVADVLDRLRGKKLVTKIVAGMGRVPKNRQEFTHVLKLTGPEQAALCVLMLRGPQTLAEIKQRSERMYDFRDAAEAEAALNAMAARADRPLVVLLPRQPGQREARYAHLLCGDPPPQPPPVSSDPSDRFTPSSPSADAARLTALEDEVRALRAEVAALRAAFERIEGSRTLPL